MTGPKWRQEGRRVETWHCGGNQSVVSALPVEAMAAFHVSVPPCVSLQIVEGDVLSRSGPQQLTIMGARGVEETTEWLSALATALDSYAWLVRHRYGAPHSRSLVSSCCVRCV